LVAYLQDHGTWLIQSGYANASIDTRDLGIGVIRAAEWLRENPPGQPAAQPAAQPVDVANLMRLTDALAARPLLERVAAMADCIGAHTVDEIVAVSARAAAWLRENPPGRPVAIEPRGCPLPGACSCVESDARPAPEVGELIRCLQIRAVSLGAEGANLRQQGDAYYFDCAATLLSQLSAPGRRQGREVE
jgi:hypothetical protein